MMGVGRTMGIQRRIERLVASLMGPRFRYSGSRREVRLATGDDILRMTFHFDLYTTSFAVASLVRWIVADDVALVEVGDDAVVDVGCLRARFQKVGPTTGELGEVNQGLLDL